MRSRDKEKRCFEHEATKIRAAQPEDRAELSKLVIQNHLALSNDCPEEWHSQFDDVAVDFAHLRDAQQFVQGYYHVAESNGRLVGAAGVTPKAGGIWNLTAVTIAHSHRRKGLGKKLVRLAIEDARSAGAVGLELVTLLELMEPAWQLYEKVGFKKVKEEVVVQQPRCMTVLWYAKSFEFPPVPGPATPWPERPPPALRVR
eukprot:CAMPEP_0194671542 /NCGR_PEP_ID=MMETSP0295-20121207/5879_1 /TAXON_ID=39354 /ORGANISM="Heterosigma akashiwo, Strain CCMP2393" /LENGTH=200 /DNA_ID=CAMNT_0039555015 /DNA_START=41 /DNA_END=640 /DNA_ORIENTATION=+